MARVVRYFGAEYTYEWLKYVASCDDVAEFWVELDAICVIYRDGIHG